MVPFAGERFQIELAAPQDSSGVILLARDNGNAVRRHSVGAFLRSFGFATATCQLVTAAEREDRLVMRQVAADVALLTTRLSLMVAAVRMEPGVIGLPLGILASGTVAAAALTLASRRPHDLQAIVSRGGRVDLVVAPESIQCPTLLIAGGADQGMVHVNERMFHRLGGTKGFDVLAGASHRFDQATFDLASRLASDWFATHLPASVLV
jgi:pimeloyl-ACP methyl ester carboxylesterase